MPICPVHMSKGMDKLFANTCIKNGTKTSMPVHIMYPWQTKLESCFSKGQGGIQICFKTFCKFYIFPKYKTGKGAGVLLIFTANSSKFWEILTSFCHLICVHFNAPALSDLDCLTTLQPSRRLTLAKLIEKCELLSSCLTQFPKLCQLKSCEKWINDNTFLVISDFLGEKHWERARVYTHPKTGTGTLDVFWSLGRLRTSSGIFGNDHVVFKNPSTTRIKISRLYLRKS